MESLKCDYLQYMTEKLVSRRCPATHAFCLSVHGVGEGCDEKRRIEGGQSWKSLDCCETLSFGPFALLAVRGTDKWAVTGGTRHQMDSRQLCYKRFTNRHFD